MPAPLSLTAPETSKQGIALARKVFETPGKAGAVATAMGVAESTISKLRSGPMDDVITALAHAGLRLVPSDHVYMHPVPHEYLRWLHGHVTQEAPALLLGGPST
jgi:hypothetical protein